MARGDRSSVLAALVVVVLAATWGICAAQKPNILLILVDDLGYNDLSMFGSEDVKTPHIDQLCSDGVNFTRAYSVAGYCSPARAGLMAGEHPWHFGHIYNPPHDLKDLTAGMPLDKTTVAETLKASGYRTMITGKWHLGTTPKHHPMKRGFDRFFGFLNGRHTYFDNSFPGKDGRPHYIYDDYNIYDDVTYLTDDFAEKSMEFMEQSKKAGKPFFIYHSVNAPHGPLYWKGVKQYKEEDVDNSIEDRDRRAYVALIKAVDDTVKQLRDKIKALGLKRETLVIFTNDNGGTERDSSNYPYRDYKGSAYEGGVRIPFCMTWPRTIRWQTQNDQVISLIDIYPTLQDVAKVKSKDKNPDLTGVNLMPFIIPSQQNKPEDKGLVREYLFGIKGERDPADVQRLATVLNYPWKLHVYRNDPDSPWDLDNEESALYNLDDDVGETTDVMDEPGNKKIARTLLDAFLPWYDKVVPEAFISANGGKVFAPNPLSVDITEAPATFKVGKEYRFKAKGSSTEGKRVYYFWETFRKEDEILNTFNNVKTTAGVKTRAKYARKHFITFNEPGEWIVRINIEDRVRWLQWTDLVVNVV